VVAAAEKTACTSSDDDATSRSERVDSNKRREVANRAVIGVTHDLIKFGGCSHDGRLKKNVNGVLRSVMRDASYREFA